MKNRKISCLIFSLFFVFSCVFTSCEVGMGTAVDLEAPYLTITSPEKFSYQPLAFVLHGKCTDNVGVKEVRITNKESGKLYGYATITEDEWEFSMTLEKEEEGEITFLCAAYDDFGNCSTKSARNITLLVDEHAPEGSGWYVERGNHKPANLKDKDYLENLDYTLSVNKDMPQNEVVYLHASFYDAMNIDYITIHLYEDESQTPVLSKTLKANPSDMNYIGDGKSMYSPVFEFTHAEFAAKGLGSGKHYMRVKYESRDNDDPVNYNESAGDTEAYFLWWPESDKPNFQVNNVENGELTVSVGSSIPLDIFDDDGLSEYYAALTETSVNYTEAQIISNAGTRNTVFGGTSTEANPIIKRTSFSNNSTQQDSPSILAPGNPNQMYLYIAAKDAKANGGEEKWNCRKVSVKVTDTSKPLLFIESPQQNTVPAIESGTESTFKITGYSLDTKGSAFVKMIYIPDDPTNAANNTSEKKSERAQALFAQYENDTSAKKVISGTNEVIWYTTLGAKEDATGGWKKQQFDISMNLISDFKNKNGALTANETKYFEIFLRDEDGNDVNKSFIILGDSLAPTINITSPNKELAVHNYETSNLKIEFKAEKASGLGIDTSSYKVTTKIGEQTIEWTPGGTNNISVNTTTKVGTITIPKATLKNWFPIQSQPTFTFYAKDKLGNGGGDGQAQRTVILSTNPSPVSITVDNPEGTYKKDETLKFKVTFTKRVKVTGTPKLRLKYSDSDSTYKYATYKTGSGSNTLQFEFTVPEGADSQKLLCTGFDIASENVLTGGATIKATELGENDIFTSISADKIFSATKTIKLDGVLPKIDNITVVAADGNKYCTKDKVIRATVKFSEEVQIEGSPTLILKVGDENENVSFAFENWNDDEIVFKHVVTGSDPQGVLKWAASYAFSSTDTPKMKDTHGNTLVLTGGKTGTSSVEIDYTPPASAPSITPAASTYNTAQTISLSNIDTNATAYFSTNGGISWIKYSTATDEQKTLGNGSYKLMTYQEDQAGNKSANSSGQDVTINNLFPEPVNFGIDLPDGYYNAGTAVKFTIDFNDQIKVSNKSDIKLTFASNADSSKTKQIELSAVPSGGKASRFEFTYTSSSTDDYKGVVVKEILFADSVQDLYGNVPAFTTTPNKLTPSNCDILNSTSGGKRTGLYLDSVAPAISTYLPADGGISSITDNKQFKITLTFDEAVFKETGYIILQRKGDWAIPAVMTNDEFLKYYNKMDAANKAIVRRMGSDGDDLKHGRTGIEVGPYRRITHGLKLNAAETAYIPDDSTKFVLAYDLGLYSGSAALNDGTQTGTFTVTVAQIRAALESVGYHQHKVDVASEYVKITGNKVEITFSEAIEDGREWELIIPDTAFRDNAENFFAGIAEDEYSFWSNNVAQPVVRVDRYTHGWGAKEPNSDGTFTTITVNQGKFKNANPAANSAAAIAPTGYVRARIDCETPGATLNYSLKSYSVAYNATGGTAQNSDYHTSSRHTIADITKANLEVRGTTGYTQGNDIIIGDGTYTTARKDYITAYATKNGFEDSKNGFEGAFKTIVYVNSGNTKLAILNVEGGTAPGGQPNVFGFPLRDATDEDEPDTAGRYSKNMFVFNGNTRTQFVFVSYEIISEDWAILLCEQNHARSYPLNSYGGSAYITKQTFWNGGTSF